MNRALMTTLTALAALGLGGAAQPGAQTPPGHPPIGPKLENAEGLIEPPPANPGDVESLDAIVKAYFASMSGAKGEPRDWDRFRSLFQPMAHLIAARPVGDHHSGLFVLSVEDFVGVNKDYFEKGGYFEKEVARRVEAYGNIAQVWSTYEARHAADEPDPYLRGVYSIQLLKDGDRWWIVNVYWDYERPGMPIPEKYLESAS